MVTSHVTYASEDDQSQPVDRPIRVLPNGDFVLPHMTFKRVLGTNKAYHVYPLKYGPSQKTIDKIVKEDILTQIPNRNDAITAIIINFTNSRGAWTAKTKLFFPCKTPADIA